MDSVEVGKLTFVPVGETASLALPGAEVLTITKTA